MKARHGIFEVTNVDRDGRPLKVGDRIGFVMRGWFQPREQESFGIITAIEERGFLKIEAVECYRRFTSTGRVISRDNIVLFTHHTYDPATRSRKFAKQEGEHLFSVYKVEQEDLDKHVQANHDAASVNSEPSNSE